MYRDIAMDLLDSIIIFKPFFVFFLICIRRQSINQSIISNKSYSNFKLYAKRRG